MPNHKRRAFAKLRRSNGTYFRYGQSSNSLRIESNLIYMQKFSQQFLLMRLRHATTDQDDISEALATNFVQSSAAANNGSSEANGKEVDDFVKEYRELRKTFHKRVIWGDRWAGRKVDWRD